MDEVMLACASSDKCGAQKVWTQVETLLDLRNQILQLLDTRLHDNSIMVLQEELRLMQTSSYYLEIQRDDSPTADQQQQQRTSRLCNSALWSLIDQQRLQRAMTLANTQVKLLLALLGMLFQGIVRGCRELEAFVNEYDQGLVDSGVAASARQKLRQTYRYVDDFESRMTWDDGPLDLQSKLIPNTGHLPVPKLRASLALKMPVMFDRFKSCLISNTVYLCWEVAGQQPKEPDQQFEIHVKSLHPAAGQFTKLTCQSYNIQVNNLMPDRYYQFSVKRADAANLVYGSWMDTITLKTLDISE
ncbi:fibronectin type III domain-containing protein 11-like [Enoplosus armatus]|uniref:fibronectin type III domain-containing protein 11-like n=1 Tax=Enoplosus armatus TaxID=215367 RepID=UPI003996B884